MSGDTTGLNTQDRLTAFKTYYVHEYLSYETSSEMITEKTKREVLERDGNKCVYCGSDRDIEQVPHHGLFRSAYHGVMYDGYNKIVLNDQHGAWNLFTICHNCHHAIHHGNTAAGKKIKEFFVRLAKMNHLILETVKPRYSYEPKL